MSLDSSDFSSVLIPQPPQIQSDIPVPFETCLKLENETDLNASELEISSQDLQSLEDFIRFDVSRKGGICCPPKYTISVQYEDKFLVGRPEQSHCLCCCCCQSPNIKFILKESNKDLFQVDLTSSFSCLGQKSRKKYLIRSWEGNKDLGLIHLTKSREDVVQQIDSIIEDCSFKMRKIGSNIYTIFNELGFKVAVLEISRGFRGGISSYGLTIVDDDISTTSKALFISATIAMDLDDRESEIKCKLIWAPIICLILIAILTIIHFIPPTSKFSLTGD